jgi:hypothetical protein
MILDPSGNLGLGVTPSAWGNVKALQVNTTASFYSSGGNTILASNYYYNGSTNLYITNNYATSYVQTNGQHQWYRSTSAQVAGTDPVFNQEMTLDASGNLLVGATSTPFPKLYVSDGTVGVGLGPYSAGSVAYAGTWTNHSLAFVTNGTERVKIDINGNLGLGVTPEAWAIGGKVIQIAGRGYWGATSTNEQDFGLNAYYDGAWKYLTTSTASATNYSQQNGQHIWQTTGSAAAHTKGDALSWTSAMTLDNSGKLFIGQTTDTTASKVQVTSSNPSSGYCASWNQSSANSGTYYYHAFLANGTQTGNINSNGTITVYATTSDYRAKTVVGSVQNAGQRIDALEPIEYDWITGGRTRGFLAHKFAEVYPNSVTGEKDAVDAEGKPIYQAIQASTPEVIADLIAEIQSLRKRVAQLESK